MTDRRFAVGYSLRAQKAVLTDRNEGSSVIPLPDLFDFGRAPEWLRKNPDTSIYAELIQDVAGLIQDVASRIKSPFQPQSWNRLTKTLSRDLRQDRLPRQADQSRGGLRRRPRRAGSRVHWKICEARQSSSCRARSPTLFNSSSKPPNRQSNRGTTSPVFLASQRSARIGATIKPVPNSAKGAGSAANRLVSSVGRQEFIAHASAETDLCSLFLDEQMPSALQKNRREDFLKLKFAVPRRCLSDFLSARTAYIKNLQRSSKEASNKKAPRRRKPPKRLRHAGRFRGAITSFSSSFQPRPRSRWWQRRRREALPRPCRSRST